MYARIYKPQSEHLDRNPLPTNSSLVSVISCRYASNGNDRQPEAEFSENMPGYPDIHVQNCATTVLLHACLFSFS